MINPDPITHHINIANLIDLLIPADANIRIDDDHDESLCNDIADHYITYYPNLPIDRDLIETIINDLTR